MANSLKEPLGLINDHANVGRKLRKAWDNRLIFPFADLPERYLRGHLAIRLECHLEILECRQAFSLVILHECAKGTSSEFSLEGGKDNNQFPMLVHNVHLIKDEEGILSGGRNHVWLKAPHELLCPFGKSLYFSFVKGDFVFLRRVDLENREEQQLPFFGVFRKSGQLPYKMVEARPQMVGNLPGEYAEPEGNGAAEVVINRFVEKLVVIMGNEGIWALREKGLDLPVEIDDALVGPVDFLPDPN